MRAQRNDPKSGQQSDGIARALGGELGARLHKGIALGLSIALVGGVLAGCGEDTSSAGGDEASQLSDAPPDGTDLAAPGADVCSETLTMDEALNFEVPQATDGGRIAHMLVTLQGHYFLSSAYGAQQAAEEAGVEIETIAAQGYASPDVQQQQLGDLLQQNLDAVVVLPSDVNGSVPLVDQAHNAGVELTVAGSLLNSNQVPQAVQSDYELGRQAADLVAKQLKEEGKAGGAGLIMAGPKQATWASNRLAGFEDRIAEKYPDISIAVATHQNFVDPTEGLNTFTDAVQSNPDIEWIYSVDYNLLEADSLPERYKGQIPYIAMGLYGTSEEALRDGTVDVIIGLMPALGARIGVARAVSLLNGDTVPAITCYPAPVYTADTLDQPSVEWEGYPSGFRP